MTGPQYRMPRPLWVILAEELPGGGIQLIASRDVRKADLRVINKPWAEDMIVSSWGSPLADRELTYHASIPQLEIEMRAHNIIRAPDLRSALEELYGRWRPTPRGDVTRG